MNNKEINHPLSTEVNQVLVLGQCQCWFGVCSTCKETVCFPSHCIRPQFPSIARNNYGKLHLLFISVAPGFACLHWHPSMTGLRTTVAPICLPLRKAFAYSPMDKQEHATLVLVFKYGDQKWFGFYSLLQEQAPAPNQHLNRLDRKGINKLCF